jgi:hypothetical protein
MRAAPTRSLRSETGSTLARRRRGSAAAMLTAPSVFAGSSSWSTPAIAAPAML